MELTDTDPLTKGDLERWERHPTLNGRGTASTLGLSPAQLGRAQEGLLLRYVQDNDLRFLNLALKVGDLLSGSGTSRGQVEEALLNAEVRINQSLDRLRSTQPAAEPSGRPDATPSVAVLYTPGSSTAAQWLSQMGKGESVACFHGEKVGEGVYASAWKPPGTITGPPWPEPNPDVNLDTWDAVSGWLASLRAGQITVLAGMPVVPARILARAVGPILNVHNGPLPAVRGLDALAWCLVTATPLAATAHRVVPKVDAGPVHASVAVAPFPMRTLASRMKAAQIIALSRAVADDPRPENIDSTTSKYYGRMHPLLRDALTGALTRKAELL